VFRHLFVLTVLVCAARGAEQAPGAAPSGQLAPPPVAPAPAAAPAPTAPAAKSVVFSMTEKDSIEGFAENREVTRRMVDRLVLAATQSSDLAKAWGTLVAPTDRVGIKVATEGGRYFSTHHGVVEAIVAGLEAAGIPREKVIVWDRESANLEAAGFIERKHGYQVRAIDPPRGFDPKATVVAPMFGKLIWGDLLFRGIHDGVTNASVANQQINAESHFASILTHDVNKVISVATFSDDEGCGVAGAMYNMTLPNIDNNRRFLQPGGPSSIIDLYGGTEVRPKVVLQIMDGLVAQYAGGPAFNPNYAFNHRTIYASKDPVAVDATALRLLERWREEARLPPIGEHGAWVQEGEVMGLGHFAEAAIEVRPLSAAP
jgi:Domain of unknown function (DUF362)